MSCIYCITNINNNKIYIGSSSNFKTRKKHHLVNLRRGKHCNTYLQRAFNKYGQDSFKFEVLEDNINQEDLIKIEQKYLDMFTPYNENIGYNIAKEAEKSALGLKRSLITRERLSKALTGRKHSEETKNKQRLIKLENALRGKNHSYVKPVFQYTKDLTFVKRWDEGVSKIAEDLNISITGISNCLNNRSKSSANYVWSRKMIMI